MALQLRVANLSRQFAPMLTRIVEVQPVLVRVARARRLSIDEEFRQETHFTPDGGREAWKPTRYYGSGTPPAYGRRQFNELRAAWAGGRGGIWRVGPRSVTFGVDSALVPQAPIIRGHLTGGQLPKQPAYVRARKLAANTSRNWNEPQIWAMWWFFFWNYGLTYSAHVMRRGLIVARRPHGLWHPALRNFATDLFRLYVARGQLLRARRRWVAPS